MNNSNNNNNGNWWALAFGVAVGGAATYYLTQTNDGKKLTKKVKKKYAKLEKEARKNLKEQSTTIAAKTNAATDTAKNWAEGATNIAKEKVATYTAKAEDVAEDTQNSFEKGIAKARMTLDAKAEQLVNKNTSLS